MFIIHKNTIDGLVSGERFAPQLKASTPTEKRTGRGARFTRNLFLDVEAHADGVDLVLRGTDKTRAGHRESEAADEADRKYLAPALYWNDETGSPRPFILASGTADDRDTLQTIRDELLEFYISADSKHFTERAAKVGLAARPFLMALIAIVGAFPPPGRVGSVTGMAPRPPMPAPTDTPRTPAELAAEKRTAALIRATLADAEFPDDNTAASRAAVDRLLNDVLNHSSAA